MVGSAKYQWSIDATSISMSEGSLLTFVVQMLDRYDRDEVSRFSGALAATHIIGHDRVVLRVIDS
jgi:hypothetical protein